MGAAAVVAGALLLLLPDREAASPWGWGVLAAAAAAATALWWAVHVLQEWTWWAPRRSDRALRTQGLSGTRYRFLWGDIKEEQRLTATALARPVPVDRPHDIIPRVAPLLHRVLQQHGKLSFTWFGPSPRVIITDPELVRDVLSNKSGDFVKTQLATRLARLLVGGIVVLDGEQWVKRRRIMNPAFHAEKLKGMLPAFTTSCGELMGRWEEFVATSVGPAAELDVWPEFQNLTGDGISRAAFGVSYQEGRRIFLLQAEQAERLVRSFRTNYIPGFSLLPTENNRRMKAIDKEVKKILRGIIEKRLQAVKNGEGNKQDLLGLLLESNSECSDGKPGSGITVEDVIDECKVFYFAGMETTGVLLAWTVVLLSMYPEWQDRAREEVLQVFGQNTPDSNGVNRLKTVTMVLYEVLRLYPPVVAMNRRTHRRTELGGVTYPPGVMLVASVLFIHRDPALWGDDADEFKPTRFAEGVSKACKDPSAFVPFSWGPRVCIGQNFALMEAKVALCMMLQRFAWELSPAYVHAPYTVLTLHPQHGVPVRLRRL